MTLLGGAMGVFLFGTDEWNERQLRAQCAAAHGYFCSAGGTLYVMWYPLHMPSQQQTLKGTVVRHTLVCMYVCIVSVVAACV